MYNTNIRFYVHRSSAHAIDLGRTDVANGVGWPSRTVLAFGALKFKAGVNVLSRR